MSVPKPIFLKEGMVVEFLWTGDKLLIGTISRRNPDEVFSDRNCCIKARNGLGYHLDNCLITKVFPEVKFRPVDILAGRLEK